MSHLESNIRLRLIVDRITKSPCSFDEIRDYLEGQSRLKDMKLAVSKRTFRRDLDDVLSYFNIEIEYNKKENRYYIEKETSIDSIGNRLIEAMNTVHVLSLNGTGAIMDFQKGSIGQPFNLWDLTEAIRKRQVVQFDYSKFWSMDVVGYYQIEPYKLKEFEHRWYLIGKDREATLVKTFGVDRIFSLKITNQTFTVDLLNVADRYKDCYGIIDDPAQAPVKIELSFNILQAAYVKSLPLHATQQVIYENAGEVGITLYIKITHDFIMKLLSFGNNVQVMQPKKLINIIKKAHLDAYDPYK